jgi:hypothetical protein
MFSVAGTFGRAVIQRVVRNRLTLIFPYASDLALNREEIRIHFNGKQ